MGERLWLDFVNSELSIRHGDALYDFESLVQWLEAAAILDLERASFVTGEILHIDGGQSAGH